MSLTKSSTLKIDTQMALLVGAGLKSESFLEIKESLAELASLTVAAGAEVVGVCTQVLESFQSATLIGQGKVADIFEMIEDTEANLVIFDRSLSGSQCRNLEQKWQVPVIDRSQLILDIFAQRAQSYEGKLQVQLAQMMDQLPRMVGGWQGSLSRQAGGIGTRGPGESALELDRRQINHKIKTVKKSLEVVRKNRAQYRSKRTKQQIPSFALIGYTNSGKSTLLNRLSHSKVFVKDQLFATLDATTRKVHLPAGPPAVATDTVGFIRRLPTHLIEAFKATLEESTEADVLLHVIDSSSEEMVTQVDVVNKLIQEFGWSHKSIIYVYNKMDQASLRQKTRANAQPRVFVSATTGQGIQSLKQLMAKVLSDRVNQTELYFSKADEYKISELKRITQVNQLRSSAHGTWVLAQLTSSMIGDWSPYLTTNLYE